MSPDNPNLQYCLQFLKNGGEIVRASRLCADATGMPVRQAIKFVQALSTPKPLDANPEVRTKTYCGECRVFFEPSTPSCPICGNTDLMLRSEVTP